MKEWDVAFEQNGGEFLGWVTFFADEVEEGPAPNILLVDGREMTFDEKIVSFSELHNT